MRHLIIALAAAFLMATLIVLDVARPLGAHPWWSQKTLIIGTPIGLLLAALAGWIRRPIALLVTFAVGLVLAFMTAKYGQTQFAASYAEDQLAGQLWYLGWIATGIFSAATISAIFNSIYEQLQTTKLPELNDRKLPNGL